MTTSQIARAAGIGEGTIFRVFADKDEVLDACMVAAMNPDHVLRELTSISLDEPLAERLAQAAHALRAHLDRVGAVAGTLYASGHRRERTLGDRPPPERLHGDRPPRDQSLGDRPAPERSPSDRPPNERSVGDRQPHGGREASMRATHDAVTELIEPDRAALRMEPGQVASVFLGMLYMRRRLLPSEAELTAEQLVDVLLNGTLNTPAGTP